MSDIGKQILGLVKSSGKAAPKMTSALKNIGNGDMQTGIARIADYFTKAGVKVGKEAGLKTGTVRGVVGTTAFFVLGGVMYLIYESLEKNNKNKELKAEGEAILKGLEEGMSDYENNKGEDSTCDEDASPELPDN